MSFFSHI